MCEKCDHNQSFMNGAIIGGLIGAAVGFLYAPDSGKETRRRLKTAAVDFREKAEPYISEAMEDAEIFKDRAAPVIKQVTDEVQDKIHNKVIPALKDMQEASEPLRQEFMEKIDQLVDEVEEKIKEEKKVAKKRFFSGVK